MDIEKLLKMAEQYEKLATSVKTISTNGADMVTIEGSTTVVTGDLIVKGSISVGDNK